MLNDLESEVTVVELDKEILPGLDKRTSGELRKQLAKRGIEFKLGTSVDSIDGKNVKFSDNTEESYECVLVAVGRAPLTENIGLESTKIKSNNGYIEVDLNTLQTAESNIYALGDIVSGTPQLAHVAFAEAVCSITHIATGSTTPINYNAIPYVVYTRPELAEVGLNSDKAKEMNIEVAQAQHSFAGVGRAMLQNQNQGLVKVYAQKEGPIKALLKDANPLVRLRAAEFLGLINKRDPRPTFYEILNEGASHAVKLITLNSAVLFHDRTENPLRFDVSKLDDPEDREEVKRRLDYFAGRLE